MNEQLIKMASAALGITPEAVQETITELMTFIRTVDARLSNMEKMVADLHALDYPVTPVATVAEIVTSDG